MREKNEQTSQSCSKQQMLKEDLSRLAIFIFHLSLRDKLQQRTRVNIKKPERTLSENVELQISKQKTHPGSHSVCPFIMQGCCSMSFCLRRDLLVPLLSPLFLQWTCTLTFSGSTEGSKAWCSGSIRASRQLMQFDTFSFKFSSENPGFPFKD